MTDLLAKAESDFEAAIAACPDFVRERFAKGQQFNCYERASNEEEEHPDDWEYYLSLGPISDFAFIAEIESEWRAKLIEAAFRVAVRSLRARGERHD